MYKSPWSILQILMSVLQAMVGVTRLVLTTSGPSSAAVCQDSGWLEINVPVLVSVCSHRQTSTVLRQSVCIMLKCSCVYSYCGRRN